MTNIKLIVIAVGLVLGGLGIVLPIQDVGDSLGGLVHHQQEVFINGLRASSANTLVIDSNADWVGGDVTVSSGQITVAKTRATGDTGSFQSVAGDTTYEGAAGGTSFYHAGVMGNFLGDNLTNTTASLHGGVIGSYNVTTDDDNPGGSAGVIGEVGDLADVAAYAILATLGGDGGSLTPRAAYGVQYFNSTASSKFDYGLDLFHAETTGYTGSAVEYGTADIRLQNGETISNSSDGTVAFGAANLTNTGSNTVTGDVTATTFIAADAYRVTNGAAFTTANPTPTQADLQAASYWPVDTSSNAVDIDIPLMAAGDVGRHLTFAVTTGHATQALTVTDGSGLTVVTQNATTGTTAEDAGDYIDCLITAAATATCVTYAAD